MSYAAAVLGALMLVIVLFDIFETIILPRTVTRRLRLTVLFYRTFNAVWGAILKAIPSGRRDWLLNAYGPFSLIVLIGVWAGLLIVSFALIQWGLGSPFRGAGREPGIGTYLYFSGVTLFTLGFGDVTPSQNLGRVIGVAEAGVGFGFLAIVISYLPVLYQSFSRREVGITLLDARAGSPPTASELLSRHARTQNMDSMVPLLHEWERWAAELLESNLSYPILAFYRSQHGHVSWLSCITAIMDTCALIRLGLQSDETWQRPLRWQAQMTFAICRHAIVDLALILNQPPSSEIPERLMPDDWERLCLWLEAAGIPLRRTDEAAQRQLAGIRRQYEPYVYALANRLLLEIPPLSHPAQQILDNWQISAWDSVSHFQSEQPRLAEPRRRRDGSAEEDASEEQTGRPPRRPLDPRK
jgi:hypothetical protein